MTQTLLTIFSFAFDDKAHSRQIEAFKDKLASRPEMRRVMNVTGASFNLMMEGEFSSLADYDAFLVEIAEDRRRVTKRMEVSFVCREERRREEGALWLPCEEGHRRVPVEEVSKVEAEGDYMRVHAAGRNWLVHSTLASLHERLGGAFVRLNRSVIVRTGFIDTLGHSGRRWDARLRDGSCYRISKPHLSDVMCLVGVDPTNKTKDSPPPRRSIE